MGSHANEIDSIFREEYGCIGPGFPVFSSLKGIEKRRLEQWRVYEYTINDIAFAEVGKKSLLSEKTRNVDDFAYIFTPWTQAGKGHHAVNQLHVKFIH